MKKSRNKDAFIQKPEYPGGQQAIRKFVSENLQYPEAALKAGIEGKVHLKYKVEFDGKVSRVKVVNGIGHGCDEEASRVVRLLKFSSPKNRGQRVSVERRITVRFKLPPKPQKKSSVTYSFTPSKSPQKTTYSYKVDLKEQP